MWGRPELQVLLEEIMSSPMSMEVALQLCEAVLIQFHTGIRSGSLAWSNMIYKALGKVSRAWAITARS